MALGSCFFRALTFERAAEGSQAWQEDALDHRAVVFVFDARVGQSVHKHALDDALDVRDDSDFARVDDSGVQIFLEAFLWQLLRYVDSARGKWVIGIDHCSRLRVASGLLTETCRYRFPCKPLASHRSRTAFSLVAPSAPSLPWPLSRLHSVGLVYWRFSLVPAD